MASGVSVNPECKTEFHNLKMNHAYRYIIFALSDDLKEVCVLSKKDPSGTYTDFVAELNEAKEKRQCRYGLLDAPYKKGDVEKSKIVMIFWSPEEATTKQKMVYSASKEAFKKELGSGIHKMIQANDDDDLGWDDIEKALVEADRYN